MNKFKGFNITEDFINKYNQEEFEYILSLLPYSKLVYPIKKNGKEFRNDISGFRPNKIPKKMLFDLYYKRLFKKNDLILAEYTYNLIIKYLEQIDRNITERMEKPSNVRSKLENKDMEYFGKLIDLLLDTELKNNVKLYFKMIDYELTKKQENYCKNELKEKIKYNEIEHVIRDKLEHYYQKKLEEYDMNFNKLLSDKDKDIENLKRNIEKESEEYENKIQNKNKLIHDLQFKVDKIQNEINQNESLFQKQIESLNNQLIKLKKDVEKKNNKIIKINRALELNKSEFNDYAKQIWNKENVELINTRKALVGKIEKLTVTKDDVNEQINVLQSKKTDLENSIKVLEEKTGVVIDNIKHVFDLIKFEPNKEDADRKLLIEEGIRLKEETILTDNRDDYLYDLKTNLERVGISNEYSFDVAQYIYASFANKMCLLIIGYDSRRIANAISLITSSMTADIISLPPGFNNCNILYSQVKELKSKVVLIENVLDSFYESIYLPLLKVNKEKFFIFSLESSENIRMIPISILKYMMVLDIDPLVTFTADEELLDAFANEDIFNINIDLSNKATNLRHLKNLNQIVILPNTVKIKIAEVMTIIDQLESTSAMYDILLFYINILAQSYGKSGELCDFIEQQGFNPFTLKMLNNTVGENVYD